MKALCEEFCEKSSLHGMHYLVSGRCALERIFWSILLVVVNIVTFVVVYNLWGSLYGAPVLAVVENPNLDLILVDFPAVTICPNSKVIRRKAVPVMESYVKNKDNYSSFENFLIAMSLMRFPFYNMGQDFVDSVNANVYPVPSENIFNIMREVGPDLSDVMSNCKWRSVHCDCKYLFRRQVTQEGLCYSFNSKTAERYEDDPADLPPLKLANNTMVSFRHNMFGRSSGLGFRLKTLAHQSLAADVVGDSYSVFVHDPEIVPELSQMTIVPNNPSEIYEISISVSVLEADRTLFRMKESIRNCSFAKKSLNCLGICRERTLLRYCKCVPYYLIPLGSTDTTVCSVQDMQCLKDISHRVRNNWVSRDNPGFPSWSLPLSMNCSCLQPCSYTSYMPEMQIFPLVVTNDTGWTRVSVIYKNYAVKYSRTAKYDLRNFIVGCGSMASLLIGFSAVAFIDFIVYFLKFCYKGCNSILDVLVNQNASTLNAKPTHKKTVAFKTQCDTTLRSKIVRNENNTSERDYWSAVFPSNEIGPIHPFIN